MDLDSDRHFSVHDVAATVKVFLRELPQPLLTEPHLTVYRQICRQYSFHFSEHLQFVILVNNFRFCSIGGNV